MYKGLSITIGFFATVMTLAAVGVAAVDKAYVDGVVIGLIGIILGWISVVCWRRALASIPRVEIETEEQKIGKKALRALGAIILIVLFYFFVMPNLVRKQVTSDMVSESIKSYNLVKSTGNKMDTCAYASVVATSMVQAKDVTGYKKWKETERAECQLAGIPPSK